MEGSWNKIHHLASMHYPSVVGCCRTTPPEGMVTGHAYTLLDTAEVSDSSGTYRIVKLRNPWATELYTGPWSDDSSEWTDDLKAQAGWTSANDGAFWLPFDLFIDRLYSTTFAIYEDFASTRTWEFTQREEQTPYELYNPVT